MGQLECHRSVTQRGAQDMAACETVLSSSNGTGLWAPSSYLHVPETGRVWGGQA